MNRPKPKTGMRNRRRAYLPMRTRRSLSVNAAENVVLTDGFPCVVALDAHDRFIAKIAFKRAGTSVVVANSRRSPAFRRPRMTIARGSHIGKAGFGRAICPQRLVPSAFYAVIADDRLSRRRSCRRTVVHAHDGGGRRARRIDHRDARKAGTVGFEKQRAAI